jgi:hypothetical protein
VGLHLKDNFLTLLVAVLYTFMQRHMYNSAFTWMLETVQDATSFQGLQFALGMKH